MFQPGLDSEAFQTSTLHVITVIQIHSRAANKAAAAGSVLNVDMLASPTASSWVSCQFMGFKFRCPGTMPAIVGTLGSTWAVIVVSNGAQARVLGLLPPGFSLHI